MQYRLVVRSRADELRVLLDVTEEPEVGLVHVRRCMLGKRNQDHGMRAMWDARKTNQPFQT